MGLIKCPDCNKNFSDRIDSCPNCGCPKDEAIEEIKIHKVEDKQKQEDNIKFKREKNFNYKKSDLMSSRELKEYAFKCIIPNLLEELNIDESCIINTNKSYKEVDYYIEIGQRIIGLDLFVEIAPSKRSFIYNEEHAKKMSDLGYEYAVAQIGVGACDPIRFERRKVFKNDEFYINYEKLKFFDYNTIKNTKFSLSNQTYDFIYKNISNHNQYTVSKETQNFQKDYHGDNYSLLFYNIAKIYDIPPKQLKFYSLFILKLAEAVNYCLDVRTLLGNFLNCVDFCKGFFLSDSEEIINKKIIPEIFTLLDDNKLINLNKYQKYTFAYFVYYFLTNGEVNCSIESVTYLNKLKIDLFESKPNYFGFDELVKLNEENKKINSYENLYKMFVDSVEFIKNNYDKYLNMTIEMNSKAKREPINFSDTNKKITKFLTDAKRKLTFLQDGFDITKNFPKYEIYTKYRRILNSYIKLLELDYFINEKLDKKTKGGKYGYFEYRKDIRARNNQSQNTIALVEEFANNFTIKTLTDNTYLLIDSCEFLVNNLKDKYLHEIKDNPKLYSSFREELSKFYNKVLMLPFDKDATDFRKGVLMIITDFIEIIELLEEKKQNSKRIEELEEELLENLQIIKEKIYEIQI